MKCSRRRFIQVLGIGASSSLLPMYSTSLLAKTLNAKATNTFALPPLEHGKRQGNQVAFDLRLQQGRSSFLPGFSTSTLGINGDYLGPVLRAKRGDTVSLNVQNNIGEESTLHWHGFTLPANMDGGPHQRIPQGKTWDAQFKIRQPASTLWYHSHQYHKTGEQVYKGMAGLFYIDDENTSQLNIPEDYGVDDLPVVIQDRAFTSNGEFRYASMMPEKMHGIHGNIILINGVVSPTLQAQKTLLRLRLLNGSNARIYNLAFHDKRPFHLIAGDCSLLSSPVQMNRLILAPGERAEILVDVSDRQQVVLKSLKGAIRTSGMMAMMMGRMGFDREFDVMKIDARQAETSPHQLARSLIKPIYLKQTDVVRTRSMEMSMGMMGMGGMGRMMGDNGNNFTINGRSMDIGRIDFSVKQDTSEIWEVSNTSPLPHPFHVHNTQFQVLSRNGQRPHSHEAGLKDTVLVNPNEIVKILIPFRHYSDSNTPYMYHCHNLEHEDQGMMGQFVVI